MMKVGIWLDDRDFAGNFMRGLATEGYRICFSSIEGEPDVNDFDFVLTNRDVGNRKFIRLVRTAEEERIYDGPPYRIFCYQHARDFVSSLRYIFHMETGINLELPGDAICKSLVFASLSGEPDATALALLTGEMLYKYFGCRCLYLNLCPIDGSKCFLPDGGDKGLLALLYYLGQERDFPLSSFIREHSHIDDIDTSISNPYFDELNSVRMQRLLKKIDELGKHSYLILDVGNHLSRCNKSLLAKADEVVVTTRDDNRFPAPFLQQGMNLIERLAAGRRIRHVVLQGEKAECMDDETFFLEDGRLDLSAMKSIQWEAGRLVKNIMEQKDDD